MDITEATKKAIERGGFITRREFRNQGVDILIKPTICPRSDHGNQIK